jgi:hypothetical protein
MKRFAAAIASTPVPVPTSRIRCGGAPDNLIKRQQAAARRTGWPVQNASVGSISIIVQYVGLPNQESGNEQG